MIQLSIDGPPGWVRFAAGSKPLQPRHQLRRSSAGTETAACRQYQRRALARPNVSTRYENSDSRSASTSARSASGISARRAPAGIRGGRGCVAAFGGRGGLVGSGMAVGGVAPLLQCRNTVREPRLRGFVSSRLDGGTPRKVRMKSEIHVRHVSSTDSTQTSVPAPGALVPPEWRRSGTVGRFAAMNRHPYLRIALIALNAGALGVASPARGQDFPFAIRPPSADVTVTTDIEYGRSDTSTLRMDVYRPANAGARRLPALVFFNRATGANRSGPFYAAWARVAASRGIVAVLPDVRGGSEAADVQALLTHLTARGDAVGIDRDAIAVFAGSGNVSVAFPFVEDPKQTAVKAAVMYYGTGAVTQFRLDLPVLYVRAGLDRPPLNQAITELASLAVSQNAPLTLLNHASGYHAFESANDDDA